ncbi:MAG: polysaccharide biosynthesis/export family protein [Gemmataceae bacterium]|nr:polysaccharide biosynthesis/export family protein [Gemmataceae bacterium]
MVRKLRLAPAIFALILGLTGCVTTHQQSVIPPVTDVPKELDKSTLPPYVIEPPDILYVEVLVPPLQPEKQPYSTALPPQPVSGQFLVRPDGTIGLGIYGTVHVTGLTCDQARERIREFIAKGVELKAAEAIQVVVDIAAYNSKVYYVITDGAGFGMQVSPFPVTGSETVLDALGRIGGIPPVGSTKKIWIARRSPGSGVEQILPVDFAAIASQGSTLTNYQVLPGDRVYVQAQKLVSIDNAIAKVLAPVERIFGVVLLGSSTVNNVSGRFFNNNNGF